MDKKSPRECRDSFLGGGFKHFVCSSLFGEDSQFDEYFSKGLKPPTSLLLSFFRVSVVVVGSFHFASQNHPKEGLFLRGNMLSGFFEEPASCERPPFFQKIGITTVSGRKFYGNQVRKNLRKVILEHPICRWFRSRRWIPPQLVFEIQPPGN